MKIHYLLGFCFLFSFGLQAQSDYQNEQQVTATLKKIASNKNAQLKSLTKTAGGKDIWMLTLSAGAPDAHPGIAIMGGVQGDHLLGTELSIKMAENILQNHPEALKKTSFYIFPNLSPDATAQYFSSMKYARQGNASPTDDDRDGKVDEDPYEDLNGDGIITMMRVEDPTGDYQMLEEDNRIMVKADPNKGDRGTYKLLSEGRDNDKDGVFNEDGAGGVYFNKNFTFGFPYFEKGAGEHPVSEVEHRALLDYLYTQWNIYAILTFAPENNLSKPLKYDKGKASKRVITSILENDAKLNEMLSEMYNEIIPKDDAPENHGEGGSAFEWSYFHFGRLAMSTPGWWPEKAKGDSINKAPKDKHANFLRYAEEQGMENVFIPWQEVQHPDFPNNKVEVGGINPFAMTHPPYPLVDSIAIKHTDFILKVAQMQPELQLVNLKQEKVDNNLTRITVDLHNNGLLPTHTEMGDKSRWLRKINVYMKVNGNQQLISGKGRQVIEKLDGDGTMQLSWLVQGSGKVTIEATAPQAGTATQTINL
ncbi:M14 family metallopeptidase [Dokdonia sinensis]|uniref:M14 family metallopeptidase n=1 Tax=Dokdonia sinensis TaxID=2479847 RepID=UPI00191C07F7|nr:M14 family metallopeptidase [Dokdonia sinensis]